LATFIAALPSLAQSTNGWDDRFWPANEKPPRAKDGTNWVFQSDAATLNLIEALRERVWAITKEDLSVVEDVLAYLPKRPEQSLAEIKLSTSVLVRNFIDQTRFPTPFDPTSIVVNTPTSSVLSFVNWNITNILTHCELPTNFFTYTPVRNLAGHEGTGAAHWTNSALYGWDALRKVLTNLIYTASDGFLINETKNNYQSGVTDELSFTCPAPTSCQFEDNSTGPEPITALTLTNASYQVFFNEEWRQFPFLSIGSDDGNAFAEYQIVGNAGFPYFYVGPPDSPLSSNGIHTAYSFEIERGGVLAASYPQGFDPSDSRYSAYVSCGFSNMPTWRAVGTFSTKSQLADLKYVVYSPNRVGASQPECSVCSFITFGFTDVSDFIELDCIGQRLVAINFGYLIWGDDGIKSEKERVHIIKWDFTYK
jgi:hypothetical protein